MNKLAPENLRVVAIYGFVISASIIVFGAAIGNWIDRNKRLFAVKVLLAVQNMSIAIACVIILGHYLLWNIKVRHTLFGMKKKILLAVKSSNGFLMFYSNIFT